MDAWRLRNDSGESPVSGVAALCDLVREGKLKASDYVYNPTLDKWMYAADVLELRGAFAPAAPKRRMGNTEATAIGCAFIVAVAFVGWLFIALLGSGLVIPVFGAIITVLFIAWIVSRLRG
jgi:hypothetical protein